jgi:hypothetical protein
MKHFLFEGEHLAPFEELRHLERAHHAFLQERYDDGFFLFSGPQIPAHGGFLIARMRCLARNPLSRRRRWRFSRITEFEPALFQPQLKDWFAQA